MAAWIWIGVLTVLAASPQDDLIAQENGEVVIRRAPDGSLPLSHFIVAAGEILGRQFVFEEAEVASRRIALAAGARMPRSEFDRFFQDMLTTSDLILLPGSGGTVTRVRNKRQLQRNEALPAKVVTLDELRQRHEFFLGQSATLVTLVVQLEHVSADELGSVLWGLVGSSPPNHVVFLTDGNTVSVTAVGTAVVRIADFIELADRPTPYVSRIFEAKTFAPEVLVPVIEEFLRKRQGGSVRNYRPEVVIALPDGRIVVHAAPSSLAVLAEFLEVIGS